jgi:acyl-coenzyme A thioesterase PaaI-like protein
MTVDHGSRLRAEGWEVMHNDGFIDLVGPLWHRTAGGQTEYAILGQDKHRNRRGVVQGGVMMTLADRSCGMVARQQSGAESLATIQLDVHFVGGAEIGDLMVSRPRAIRVTKSLIFMTTEVRVGDRCAITANGVFKIMRASGRPGAPD